MNDPRKPYAVTTQDVDGGTRREYGTLKTAEKRFKEMSGYSLQGSLEDRYADRVDAGLPIPAVESLDCIRQVSNYGTVVTFWNRAAFNKNRGK